MNEGDSLQTLLAEFFQLPADTPPAMLTQETVPQWDSLASVQLITELQGAYHVQFELEEIEGLTSYKAISSALKRKKATV